VSESEDDGSESSDSNDDDRSVVVNPAQTGLIKKYKDACGAAASPPTTTCARKWCVFAEAMREFLNMSRSDCLVYAEKRGSIGVYWLKFLIWGGSGFKKFCY
jgi:hypothetical protein